MFKRITKKQEKHEHDEELGLDDEAKQMFGMQDTDSDESDTDLDSDSNLNDGDGDLDVVDLRTEWLAADGGESEDEDDDEEGLSLNEDMDENSPIPLTEAVKNPIYHITAEKDVRSCIVCPKKLLKNDKMVELHVASAAHVRRFQKFCKLAENPNNRSKDPRRLAAAISQKSTTATKTKGISKRGLKRKQKLEAIKQKREKTKQIIERKKRERGKKEACENTGTDNTGEGDAAVSHSDKPTSERPKKRRKVSDEAAAHELCGDSGNAGLQAVEVKPSEGTKKRRGIRQRLKANAKASAKCGVDSGEAEAETSESKQKGYDRTNASPKSDMHAFKVRFWEDGGIITNEDALARGMKKRDLIRIRTKGHTGRAGAGRFARLSDTRAVKDKSKRKVRPEGKDAVRKHFTRKKPVRYFNEPKKEVGPKKVSRKERRLEAKERNGTVKGDGKKRIEKSQSRRGEETADDLVIFD